MYHIYHSERVRLPIYHADTEAGIETLAEIIRNSGANVLGFDTEMVDGRVNRVLPGQSPPTVVVQLASKDGIFVFHLWSMLQCERPALPEGLRRLLTSQTITKVGFALEGDIASLMRTFGTDATKKSPMPARTVDLAALLSDLGYPVSNLADVARYFCSLELSKRPHNWIMPFVIDQPPHQPFCRGDALEYAALDALVCLDAYNAVRTPMIVHTFPLYTPGTASSDTMLEQWLAGKNVKNSSPAGLISYIAHNYNPWRMSFPNSEARIRFATDYVTRKHIQPCASA